MKNRPTRRRTSKPHTLTISAMQISTFARWRLHPPKCFPSVEDTDLGTSKRTIVRTKLPIPIFTATIRRSRKGSAQGTRPESFRAERAPSADFGGGNLMLRQLCLGLALAAGLLAATGCSHCKDRCSTSSACCPPPCCDGTAPTATQAYSVPMAPGCCNGR